MRFSSRQLLLCALATSAPVLQQAAPTPSTGCDSTHVLTVLFVGNSYTYVNNVPHLVEAIAQRLSGPCIRTSTIAEGGATLALHWQADSVVRRIRDGRWTHVVLQEQSSLGEQWWVNGRPRIGSSGAAFTEYANRFAEVIKAAGATPVLLAHWSDEGAPPRDQQALDYAFATAARRSGSTLALVGDAIKKMEANKTAPTPYVDGHHLSSAGSYLEALVLYATVTHTSPLGAARQLEGAPVEFNRGIVRDSVVVLVNLSATTARRLQQLASATVTEQAHRAPAPKAPRPLSEEYPMIGARGEHMRDASVRGDWTGSTTAMPAPPHTIVVVQVAMGRTGVPDSVYLRAGPVALSGAVARKIQNDELWLRGDLMATRRIGRTGAPQPIAIELHGIMRQQALCGVVTMHQDGDATMPSFTAVGTFSLKRN